MIKVNIPNICQNEQRYALDILLDEFLGLACDVESYGGDVIEITRPGDSDAGSARCKKYLTPRFALKKRLKGNRSNRA